MGRLKEQLSKIVINATQGVHSPPWCTPLKRGSSFLTGASFYCRVEAAYPEVSVSQHLFAITCRSFARQIVGLGYAAMGERIIPIGIAVICITLAMVAAAVVISI